MVRLHARSSRINFGVRDWQGWKGVLLARVLDAGIPPGMRLLSATKATALVG